MKLTIDTDVLRQRKLFIATPMYGGMCSGEYTSSCLKLAILCVRYGIECYFSYLYNESLVTRARNYLADEFLRSDCTHMMFIDSDIGFDPNDVIMLLALCEPDSDKEVICGPYPKKNISWEKIKMAVEQGKADADPNALENYIGDYVLNTLDAKGFPLDKPVEVLEGGTGFMMIQRSALDKYRQAYPQFLYRPDHSRTKHFDGSQQIMAYFDCVIEPQTKRYLSEDYMFCQWARKAGIRIWMCPWMRLSHIGTYRFGGSLAALAEIGASSTHSREPPRSGGVVSFVENPQRRT